MRLRGHTFWGCDCSIASYSWMRSVASTHPSLRYLYTRTKWCVEACQDLPDQVRSKRYTDFGENTIGWGYVSFVGKRYEFMRGQYFGLGTRMEKETARHELVSGGGGESSMKIGEHETLTMEVGHGCLDSHESSIAYGLLGKPKDTVIAEEHGVRRVFKKVSIPANLQADGILVYAVLGPRSTDIVTRAPNGRIVRRESYAGGESFSVCHVQRTVR